MRTKQIAGLLGLIFASVTFGQDDVRPGRVIIPPILRPPVIVRPTVPDSTSVQVSQLGTNAEAAQKYHRDILSAVKSALPSYQDQALTKHLAAIASKYVNGDQPLKVNLETLEKIFQIKIPGRGEVYEKDFAYEVYPEQGKIYAYRSLQSLPSYPLGRGLEEEKLSTRTHLALLEQFGLDRSKFHSLRTNLILSEGVEKQAENKFGAPTAAQVESVFTYGVRSLEGLLVEGSSVKVISHDAKNFEGLQINFPAFRFHKDLASFEVKDKEQLLKEASEYIKMHLNPKHELNVRMAVVLRPVLSQGRTVFIPALKVGLHSRPMNDVLADEKAEAGDLFYLDLTRKQVAYELPILKETSEGGE